MEKTLHDIFAQPPEVLAQNRRRHASSLRVKHLGWENTCKFNILFYNVMFLCKSFNDEQALWANWAPVLLSFYGKSMARRI